ncbi:GNAT family N-acetyltransferase [Nonomuraea sp. NPDC050328]|uniref:GNAT family N-acetyltransferase n=1 Tax=Nonomuraea sp. NPDC050328 TaxID=3364361 RepID=UPI003787974E
MTIYTTDRLTVRMWTDSPADVKRLDDIMSREEVTRWLPGAVPPAADLVPRYRAHSEPDPTLGVWAIEERETGVVAGTILLKRLPNGDDEVEVGWHLHPDMWGRGYATEAARGALERAWAAGIGEVYALTFPDNHPSQAVCRRIGMSHIGQTDRWYGVQAELFRVERAL